LRLGGHDAPTPAPVAGEPVVPIDYARFTIDAGVKILFADPYSPWQRGTNENTNGLLRQCFAKGRSVSLERPRDRSRRPRVNYKPRKTLGWKTPAKARR
jgi:IS30 family transposase